MLLKSFSLVLFAIALVKKKKGKEMVKWKIENFLITFIVLSAVKCDPIAPLNTNLRLPRAIRPLHYDLHLETAVHDGGIRNYGGEVEIKLQVLENTSSVVIHQRGLNLISVNLNTDTGLGLPIGTETYNNVTEFLTIPTSNQLNVGDNLTLTIKFSGKLQSGTAGFYRSQYQMKGENFPR